MRSSLTGRSVRGRLRVEPSSAHRDLATFTRRGRQTTDGLPVTVKALEIGTHRQLVEVRPDGLLYGSSLRWSWVTTVRRSAASTSRPTWSVRELSMGWPRSGSLQASTPAPTWAFSPRAGSPCSPGMLPSLLRWRGSSSRSGSSASSPQLPTGTSAIPESFTGEQVVLADWLLQLFERGASGCRAGWAGPEDDHLGLRHRSHPELP
jgi:hypothetical protein